jgi:hypothetical protein
MAVKKWASPTFYLLHFCLKVAPGKYSKLSEQVCVEFWYVGTLAKSMAGELFPSAPSLQRCVML